MSPLETTPDAQRPSSAPDLNLNNDPRWLLIGRILQSAPFQKSSNLHALLSYLAKYSIQGNAEGLTERQIGMAVFHKPTGYSPAEDSAVRVNVRNLRLRLHEYFDQEGRNEPLRLEIPKGSYALEFVEARQEPRPLQEPAQPAPPAAQPTRRGWVLEILFGLAMTAAVVCAIGWYRAATTVLHPSVPWPLNAVIQPDRQTEVVVSDSSLMLRLLSDHEITLNEYLQPDFRKNLIPPHLPENIERLMEYASDSQLPSFADLTAVSVLVKFAAPVNNRLIVTSARDLDQHDLAQGNYVFVGSPTSNPWVELFADKLNFQEVEQSVGGRMYFLNRNPLPGEAKQYYGLASTGSTGEDYATISLLPDQMGQGNVMILQGLRQEGTEALSALLADAGDRERLEKAVRGKAQSASPYFEALIRSRAVAGAPVSVNTVAVRSIHP